MFANRIHAALMLTVLVGLSGTVASAEVFWITDKSDLPNWTIQPNDPNDADTIRFSGPTGLYADLCHAERAFGGKPLLEIDAQAKKIQLRFVPPATADCTNFWKPVCGLNGSFGPLEVGRWEFFCKHTNLPFSIQFEVVHSRPLYYVDAGAKGANDGSGWANAFVDLQTALAVAGVNSEIHVAQGIYRPDMGHNAKPRDRNATFLLRDGVVLRGGYAGANASNPNARDVIAYETILSGDLRTNDDPNTHIRRMMGDPHRADNSYHVVSIRDAGASVVLDGVTITGGHALGEATDDADIGGGIYIRGANLLIRDCLIIGNSAASHGGGVYTRDRNSLTLIACAIAGNWSGARGGGIYKDWGSDVLLERCLVSGNGTSSTGGGVATQHDGSLTASNCIISGNVADDGGGLYASMAVVTLDHCTFTGNMARQGASLALSASSDASKSVVRATNCILWDASNSIWTRGDVRPQITYSDVQGSWPGQGNINADPCFVEPGYWLDQSKTPKDLTDDIWVDGNYNLRWDSPCIDAGDPRTTPDLGATDFAGRPRLLGGAVEMGAYELRNDPPVADAGDSTLYGFTLTDDGVGTVTLDAGRSHDPEGMPLTYRWYCGGEIISKEQRFTIDLPIGAHTFILIVNDGVSDSAADEVTANVDTTIETSVSISPLVIWRSHPGKSIIATLVLPKGKRAGDFDRTWPMLMFPGGIKSTQQTSSIWLNGTAYAKGYFNRADLLSVVRENGRVELTIIGRLRDNRFISARATVQIK